VIKEGSGAALLYFPRIARLTVWQSDRQLARCLVRSSENKCSIFVATRKQVICVKG
jgi:hypothetical protein